jgi:hypothetical protein
MDFIPPKERSIQLEGKVQDQLHRLFQDVLFFPGHEKTAAPDWR